MTDFGFDPLIAAVMLAVGLLLGFVGAGGAGLVVALLTSLFGVPVHIAVGTSLAAMVATTGFGAVSHWREGNADRTVLLWAGLGGVVGAYGGTTLALELPPARLKLLAGTALLVSAGLVYWRTRLQIADAPIGALTVRQRLTAAFVGLYSGLLSGSFGVGVAPYLQVGLITLLRVPLRRTVGTTMGVLALIALAGAGHLAVHQLVSFGLLVSVVAGLSVGSYAGAKLTNRAPPLLLRWILVLVLASAGLLLILG